MHNKKLILFSPSSYLLRGWVSVCMSALLLMCYMFDFSDTTRFFIVLITFFWGGELFIRGSILELGRFYAGFNAFVIVSSTAAFLFAVLNGWHEDSTLAIPGATAILPFIFVCANFIKYFELKHIGNSRRFIESLDGFISKSVFKLQGDGETKKVFASELELGDLLLIKNGERLAVDCEIVKGATIIDESLLTGNITLAAKQPGDLVLAGSINKGGDIQAKAISLKGSSKIAKILDEVKKSETKKMLVPSMLEVYAFKVLILFCALASAQFIFGIVTDPEHIFHWFLVFLLFLILSSPVTYMAAVLVPVYFTIRNARKNEIYIQNGHALNMLRDSSLIFIDKTGTLTSGRLEVAEAIPAEGFAAADVLSWAYTAQCSADNIFAYALKEYARKQKIAMPKLSSIELHPSFGTVVKEGKNTIIAGRKTWLESKGITDLPASEETKKTVFYVAKNGKYIGAIYFKDRLRANAKGAISFLKAIGKKICLISGDNIGAVGAAAKMVGIDEFYGNMYPQDKAAKVSAADNVGERTVMLGDGFNDILALLQAGAGVAFSSANNVFSSWVDIIIKDRDFGAFKKVFDFEKCRRSVIKQNIYISVFCGIFVYWNIVIGSKTFPWYQMLLIMLFTILIIIINSTRIKHG